MPNLNSQNKFDIPYPQASLEALGQGEKYTIGKATSKLSHIKSDKPVFAFDYISLNKTDFCFNSNLINGSKEYARLIDSLKKISSKRMFS